MRWAMIGLACAGCHWAAGGFGRRGGVVDDDMGIIDDGPRCHRVRAAPAPPAAPDVPAEAHPDYARLAAYRSYVRIARVADAADRFLVLADCSDASGQVYAVRPDGTVRWEADHVDAAAAAPRAVPAEREAAA